MDEQEFLTSLSDDELMEYFESVNEQEKMEIKAFKQKGKKKNDK